MEIHHLFFEFGFRRIQRKIRGVGRTAIVLNFATNSERIKKFCGLDIPISVQSSKQK
ncbi:hypothetical protein LEP1GSC060_2019 [Leptospira weilii serovar Ranarum str. ICFT]|uniref:Uncharacterized protein n=1 Tax=Leptospira weilii serovar Ranarum str. ICFT TaxID=1218598 RepID=N1WAA8_9LEPT|nr:hypothetical protein LEP1GSC060_2019 [Leptospira weilii serovar Ranarum str. ICFT]